MLRPDHLLKPTPKGLYCQIGDFYLDPVRSAVERAVITHGHADHARAGHTSVLATPDTLAIMAVRYGEKFAKQKQPLAFGQSVTMNGVTVSFAPAGHILGSAQAIIDYRGLRVVFTGDYKRRSDPTCQPFEVIPNTHVLISEATFGIPVFRHPDSDGEIAKLLKNKSLFPDATHLVGVYSLGKAQRLIRLLRIHGHDGPIYIHKSLEQLCHLYQSRGIDLGQLIVVGANEQNEISREKRCCGQFVLGPPPAFSGTWGNQFIAPIYAFASGWMTLRKRAKNGGIEMPIILSDHADWDELTQTIADFAPEELWVTYGREDALCRWAELNGQKARPLRLVSYNEAAE